MNHCLGRVDALTTYPSTTATATMKLRLRSLETRETLRIEIPNPASLSHLKQLISQSLPSLPPSSSLHLSLNRSTALLSSSPDDSLQSLGVTSGDLIYFTTNPSAFTSPNYASLAPIVKSEKGETSNLGGRVEKTLELDNRKGKLPDNREEGISSSEDTHVEKALELDAPKGKNLEFDTLKEGIFNSEDTYTEKTIELDTQKEGTSNPDIYVGETAEFDGETSSMIKEDDYVEPMEIDSGCKSFSVPGFLRRVFSEELGDDSGCNHKLLVIAIHAVLLESGLVGFDPSSKTTDYRFHVPEEWPAGSLRMTLRYTLPDIISSVGGMDDTVNINHAFLKLNSIGKFVGIYGSLPNGTVVHSVHVDENKLVPFLNVIWANCGSTEEALSENGVFSTSPEKEVFEFWRTVKDRLALPLLIDLCERSGFELPACFMRLPTDLKLKILELLPGVDIAKVGSVCSELRYLSSSEDLWKRKYEEEKFGSAESVEGSKKWKERFKTSWGIRKRVRNARARRPSHFFQQERRQHPPWFIGGRNPSLDRPRIIGGPHDIFGNSDIQLRPGMQGLPLPGRRNTVPRCILGEPDI